ncbi:hypothetical protein [Streptomyces sp. Tu 3180]|uniref:hypothetical protein n=1 Tax=Streptomyces sp. Tu 3180 TaxID=2682611 RepID=UPI001356F457|nr:hypothetical protein [Streptomyces sp. Tu 3180]KAF3463145.1 hypothetical protein GL259_15140 [Streptomyces sp. Tu 3180]
MKARLTHFARLADPLPRLLPRLLPPGRGRHRRSAPPPVPPLLSPGVAPGVEPPAVARAGARRLRGEDTAPVRPRPVAHGCREEARRQRARRRALWLAVHGVDVGPRVIHGVEVTA